MSQYKTLEDKYANHLSTKGAISVNTGTAALHVSLEALQLPPGSKVIVPEFTMYASALAVYYARLTPVFVDCDENLLIDLDKVEQSIDNQTKVIMVTHVYGRTVDMTRVMDIAKKNNLRIIEDACEAQGAMHNGQPIGSFDIGCFSLYRNKIVHAEEGGIVASNDLEFLKIVEDMKSMSFGTAHNYYHERIGFNYRMTNSQASLAIKSLEQIKNSLIKREELKNHFNLLIDKENQMPDNRQVVWVYDMVHHNSNLVVKELKKRGIAARHSFKPMSIQPLFSDYKSDNSKSLHFSENVFYVHIDIADSFTQIEKKAAIIKEVMRKFD